MPPTSAVAGAKDDGGNEHVRRAGRSHLYRSAVVNAATRLSEAGVLCCWVVFQHDQPQSQPQPPSGQKRAELSANTGAGVGSSAVGANGEVLPPAVVVTDAASKDAAINAAAALGAGRKPTRQRSGNSVREFGLQLPVVVEGVELWVMARRQVGDGDGSGDQGGGDRLKRLLGGSVRLLEGGVFVMRGEGAGDERAVTADARSLAARVPSSPQYIVAGDAQRSATPLSALFTALERRVERHAIINQGFVRLGAQFCLPMREDEHAGDLCSPAVDAELFAPATGRASCSWSMSMRLCGFQVCASVSVHSCNGLRWLRSADIGLMGQLEGR